MNMQPKERLPVMAAVHLAGAVEAMQLADHALGVALDALQPIELEQQPAGLGSYDVIGARESVRLFVSLFARHACGFRLAPSSGKARELIEATGDDPRNLAGLERAALALDFAVAYVEETIDVIDETGDGEGDGLYGPLLAAEHVLGRISETIACNLVRGQGPGRSFGCN
jgi:hypothetical protein